MILSVFGYDMTISELITVGCSLFLSLFYAVKTRGIKNIIKEIVDMNYKFKTQQNAEPAKGQTFETTKPVYRLNNATGELENTGDVQDLQEIINSCIDSALDRALDRLMPKVQQAEELAELDTMREDLDFAMQTCDLAEEYRAKYKLPDSYSVNDVFAHVAKEAELLKARIDTVQAVNKDKEQNNEKTKTIEESK